MTHAATHKHHAHPKHNNRHLRQRHRRAIATLRSHPPCNRG